MHTDGRGKMPIGEGMNGGGGGMVGMGLESHGYGASHPHDTIPTSHPHLNSYIFHDSPSPPPSPHPLSYPAHIMSRRSEAPIPALHPASFDHHQHHHYLHHHPTRAFEDQLSARFAGLDLETGSGGSVREEQARAAIRDAQGDFGPSDHIPFPFAPPDHRPPTSPPDPLADTATSVIKPFLMDSPMQVRSRSSSAAEDHHDHVLHKRYSDSNLSRQSQQQSYLALLAHEERLHGLKGGRNLAGMGPGIGGGLDVDDLLGGWYSRPWREVPPSGYVCKLWYVTWVSLDLTEFSTFCFSLAHSMSPS
ncbi:hypothetical protein HDV00_001629 [Rhizophlyctis rosea]|nr:hypothetical protein HDV00_001629 [Rhizophlyctis rosea]